MAKKTILVCGGAGYIGSHTVIELLNKGYEVVIADNLEYGHKQAVSGDSRLVVGDLRDKVFVSDLFKQFKFDAVIDFAAYIEVGESVENPLKYFENNVSGAMNVLEAMKHNDVNHIVFSSTAAVYGLPKIVPINEDSPTIPINPYGESKLMTEKILKWSDEAHGITYAALRYFNVAGAHLSGKIGEDHRPETHLIPCVIKSALNGETVGIFGDDYNTPDGTCVRDYIHVTDLANAHVLAVEKLIGGSASSVYNLGNGAGFSNMEILSMAKKVSGIDIKHEVRPRRAGDPDVLIASSEKICSELGWKPKFAALEKIIETAFNWHKNNPKGYGNE